MVGCPSPLVLSFVLVGPSQLGDPGSTSSEFAQLSIDGFLNIPANIHQLEHGRSVVIPFDTRRAAAKEHHVEHVTGIACVVVVGTRSRRETDERRAGPIAIILRSAESAKDQFDGGRCESSPQQLEVLQAPQVWKNPHKLDNVVGGKTNRKVCDLGAREEEMLKPNHSLPPVAPVAFEVKSDQCW